LKNSRNFKPKELERLVDSYDPRKLTAAHRAIAKELREQFNKNLTQAQRDGILKDGIENYVTHVWGADADDNPAVRKLLHELRDGNFSTNTFMARKRVFETAFMGELFGKKLKIQDPVALAAFNGFGFARAAAARAAVDRIRATGRQGSDGLPLVSFRGSGERVAGEDGLRDALFIDPKKTRNQKISGKQIAGLERRGELQKLIQEGKILRRKDKNKQDVFLWNLSDHRVVDHSALRDWRVLTSDGEGNPVIVNVDMVVHPEAYDYITKQLGMQKSQLGQTGLGKAAFKFSREAKAVLTAGDFFHIAQEGLRAIMTGISPFGIEKWNLSDDPVLAYGVEHGLTLGVNFGDIQAFQEGIIPGHSVVLEKIPLFGKYNEWLNDFMFKRQNGACKICGKQNLDGKRLFIDHDHKTKKFRGLLCSRCNLLLGQAKDNIQILYKAADYLEAKSGSLNV